MVAYAQLFSLGSNVKIFKTEELVLTGVPQFKCDSLWWWFGTVVWVPYLR